MRTKLSITGWACLLSGCMASALAGPVSPGESRTSTVRQWPEAPEGFASVNAMGQNGVTGGAGGKTVTVTTREELKRFAESTDPYVIRVRGSIDLKDGSRDPRIDVASDKTIVGVGKTAEIVGGRLYPLAGVHNVIIRNLTIRNSPTDGVTMDGAHHVWVDHCRFHGHADGCLDSRKGTTCLTVSWCIFSDSYKPFGIGWDTEVAAQMTIHHNWFRNNQYRNPRAGQVLRAHLYNNYLKDIRVRRNWAADGTRMVVENSFFDNVANPHDSHSPGGKGSSGGVVFASGNIYHKTRGRKDSHKNMPFNPREFYESELDRTEAVPDLISEYAGPRESIGR